MIEVLMTILLIVAGDALHDVLAALWHAIFHRDTQQLGDNIRKGDTVVIENCTGGADFITITKLEKGGKFKSRAATQAERVVWAQDPGHVQLEENCPAEHVAPELAKQRA